MFTKQHYVAVAEMLKQRRADIIADRQLDEYQRAAAMTANNEIVMRFVRLFEADNPRFKYLLFIGAACADVASDARQE